MQDNFVEWFVPREKRQPEVLKGGLKKRGRRTYVRENKISLLLQKVNLFRGSSILSAFIIACAKLRHLLCETGEPISVVVVG